LASEADTKAQANAPRSDSRAAHFRVFLRRQPCFSKNESHDTVAEQFIEILAATGVKTCSSAEKNCCRPPLAPW
jgi:hypothetical protein